MGYERRYVTPRQGRVAVLAAGYSHGLRQGLRRVAIRILGGESIFLSLGAFVVDVGYSVVCARSGFMR